LGAGEPPACNSCGDRLAHASLCEPRNCGAEQSTVDPAPVRQVFICQRAGREYETPALSPALVVRTGGRRLSCGSHLCWAPIPQITSGSVKSRGSRTPWCSTRATAAASRK